MKHFNSLRPNKETIESIYGDEKQTVPSSGIEAKTNYVVPSGKQDECNVTVFTPGLIIEGNVSSETDMIIRGTISGNIVCRSDINLSGRVTGNIRGKNVRINGGTVKGDIQCEEKLSIEKSHIEGNLAAAQAQINNRINGDITVQGTLSLLREANIQGNITAAGLGVEEGAMMSGQITITRDCKEPFPASRDRHRPVAPSAPVESPVVVVQPASRIRSSGKPCPDVDGQLSLQARTESAGAKK